MEDKKKCFKRYKPVKDERSKIDNVRQRARKRKDTRRSVTRREETKRECVCKGTEDGSLGERIKKSVGKRVGGRDF